MSRRFLPRLSGTNLLIIVTVLISVFARADIIAVTQYWQDPALILEGEFYRLLTNAFFHSDISHLVFNMFVIYIYGNLLERRIGTIRTGVIYFAGVIGSGIVWTLLRTKPSLGASAGAFSLIAGSIVLAADSRLSAEIPVFDKITQNRVLGGLTTVLGISSLIQVLALAQAFLGFGFINVAISTIQILDPLTQLSANITNLAAGSEIAQLSHLSGFLSGAVLAYVFDRETARTHIRLFSIYLLFFLLIYLQITPYLVIVGIFGIVMYPIYVGTKESQEEDDADDPEEEDQVSTE